MSQTLVLFPAPPGGLHWSILEGERDAVVRASHGDSLASLDMALLQSVRSTIIVLPSEDVFVSQAVLPTRSEHDARQAAPFLIEEELASRLEEVDVAIGAPDEDGQRWVFAAAKSAVEAWRDTCRPYLRGTVSTVPDCLLVAEDDAALTLRHERGRVIYLYGEALRQPGRAIGGAANGRLFDSLLHSLAASASEGLIAVSPALGLAGERIKPLEGRPLDLAAHGLPEVALKRMPALFGQRSGAGLDWSRTPGLFARSAALAASLLIGLGLFMLGESAYLLQRAERYDAASVELVQTAFPAISGPLDPVRARRILDERLAERHGRERSGEFLPLLAALANLSDGHDSVVIQTIRYDQSRPELNVSARYDVFSDFDALSEDAQARNIELVDQGARDGAAGIDGDFMLRIP
ncbi:type II secretion system protein GspL [uncultured Maricaulis sp.]|uniref:type II secretion system protein GspL n=1 Tax=uncultured Maricaulis sp. TaxID=174710 RepID=UPI0030DA85C8|tara:strand:+ start:8646 stop:9869 length:1224 start_codon:yes stop_codon:yes gene_type:complete